MQNDALENSNFVEIAKMNQKEEAQVKDLNLETVAIGQTKQGPVYDADEGKY